jgi:hypothetical protein
MVFWSRITKPTSKRFSRCWEFKFRDSSLRKPWMTIQWLFKFAVSDLLRCRWFCWPHSSPVEYQHCIFNHWQRQRTFSRQWFGIANEWEKHLKNLHMWISWCRRTTFSVVNSIYNAEHVWFRRILCRQDLNIWWNLLCHDWFCTWDCHTDTIKLRL